MKIKSVFFLMLILVSCTPKQFNLNDYANYLVKYAKQKVTHPSNDFSVYIQHGWEWKEEDYDGNENFIYALDASSQPDEKGFIDVLSIQKVKSFGGNVDLKEEYEYLLEQSKKQTGYAIKIIESGKTELFVQDAYFIHSRSNSGAYGESEGISFILNGGEEGVFYYLNASASRTDDLKMNMAILIQSLKTFETHSN